MSDEMDARPFLLALKSNPKERTLWNQPVLDTPLETRFFFARTYLSDVEQDSWDFVPMPSSVDRFYSNQLDLRKHGQRLTRWFAEYRDASLECPDAFWFYWGSYSSEVWQLVEQHFEVSALKGLPQAYSVAKIQDMIGHFQDPKLPCVPVQTRLFEGQNTCGLYRAGGEKDILSLVCEQGKGLEGKRFRRVRPTSTSWHYNSALEFAKTHDPQTLDVLVVLDVESDGLKAVVPNLCGSVAQDRKYEHEVTLEPNVVITICSVECDVPIVYFVSNSVVRYHTPVEGTLKFVVRATVRPWRPQEDRDIPLLPLLEPHRL